MCMHRKALPDKVDKFHSHAILLKAEDTVNLSASYNAEIVTHGYHYISIIMRGCNAI